jgi:hypothetical protein
MQPMRASLATAALIAVGVAGCGGDSPTEKVRKTVDSFLTGIANADGKKTCGQLTAGGQREFETIAGYFVPERERTPGCIGTAEAFGGNLADQVRADLPHAKAQIRVEEDRAAAHPEGGPGTLLLRRTKDDWRIEHVFTGGWRELGIPHYPPGARPKPRATED